MWRVLLFMLSSLALAAEEPVPERTDFVRVLKEQEKTLLQTGITSYQKGTQTVDLIGAVHIGDFAYYEELNRTFATYPTLLFEMIGGEGLGGEKQPLGEAADPQDPEPDQPAVEQEVEDGEPGIGLSLLGSAYDGFATVLDLVPQSEVIDYTRKNFIHADLSVAEFNQAMEARNQSLFTIFLKSSLHSMLHPPKRPPNDFALLYGLLRKDPNRMKRELAYQLGEADDAAGQVFGDTVIIRERNDRCLEVLKAQLAKGDSKIGIFYGAAHFPDLEEKLVEMGFTKNKHTWLTAWSIKNR